jgi:hypothetical protein
MGELTLKRVAVVDYILLGGDNMDLALARLLQQQPKASGQRGYVAVARPVALVPHGEGCSASQTTIPGFLEHREFPGRASCH